MTELRINPAARRRRRPPAAINATGSTTSVDNSLGEQTPTNDNDGMQGSPPTQLRAQYITQSELAELRRMKTYMQHYERLRKAVKKKYESGAQVEQGELALQVKQIERKSFSFEKLCELIGEEQTLCLKERIRPTTSVRMQVIEGQMLTDENAVLEVPS